MIQKFDNVWANSGQKGTAPTATKQDTGFVRREKPIRQLFNWILNGIQEKLNFTIDNVTPVYDQLTNTEKEFMLASGLWQGGWGLPGEASNTLDNTSNVVDIKTCFIDGVSCLLVLDSSNVIKRYNARTKALISTSHDLSGDITGTGSALSFCTDNIAVYAFFEMSSGAHKVGKWNIEDWIYDVSWTSGGEDLSSGALNNDPQVIIADSTHIAIAMTNNDISAIDDNIYVLQTSDGTITTSGNGDATVSANNICTGSITSDGTNLFFTTNDSDISSTCATCTATIADATTGTGGGYPDSFQSDDLKMITIGDSVFACSTNDAVVDGTTIIKHIKSDAILYDSILAGTADSGNTAAQSFFGGCEQLIFDGVNIWIGTSIEVDGAGTTYRMAVVGFSPLVMSQYEKGAVITPLDFTQIMKGPYQLPVAPPAGKLGPKMTFDGRDLWCVGAGTQYIYRVPQINKR